MRRASPGIVAALGLGLLLPATLYAADAAVTRSEMEAFVFAMIGTASAVVFGAFWVLLNATVGRAERSFADAASSVKGSMNALTSEMKEINARLRALEDRNTREDGRDPYDSPHRRRATDRDDEDHAGERGRG
jgi:hypothetical protein